MSVNDKERAAYAAWKAQRAAQPHRMVGITWTTAMILAFLRRAIQSRAGALAG
jgi:hypothetical protein